MKPEDFELPEPDTHCFDDGTGKDCWGYSPEQVSSILLAFSEAQKGAVKAEDKVDAERMDWLDVNLAGDFCMSANPHGTGWWVRRLGDYLPDYRDSLREAIDAAIAATKDSTS